MTYDMLQLLCQHGTGCIALLCFTSFFMLLVWCGLRSDQVKAEQSPQAIGCLKELHGYFVALEEASPSESDYKYKWWANRISRAIDEEEIYDLKHND